MVFLKLLCAVMSMMCVLRQATFCKLEPKHFTAETTGCYKFTEKVITRVSLGEGARAAMVMSFRVRL